MITTLWENALTFVKYMLKYSDGILMFDGILKVHTTFRCVCLGVCVCVSWVHVCGEREREMKKMPMCQEVAS